MAIRQLVASVSATVILFIPALIELFAYPDTDASSSWQRGVIAFPVIFAMVAPIVFMSARLLLTNGYSTLRLFVLGFGFLAALLSVALITPVVIVGSYVALFPLSEALAPALAFVLAVSLISLPAAIVWWSIAGNKHAKRKDI